jgi:hypothetical protein
MADDDYEEYADDLVEDEEVEVAGDEPHDMLL